MRRIACLAALCFSVGCSSQKTSTDARGAASSDEKSAGSSTSQGSDPAAAPTMPLLTTSVDPKADHAAANLDSADGGGLPEGCEVGKFCKSEVLDGQSCGTLTLAQDIEKKTVPGNLLLVFDQSLSMSDPWGTTGQTKLVAAQAAIANAVMSLQDSLTVGALFFPTAACFAGGGAAIDIIGTILGAAGAAGDAMGGTAGANGGIDLAGLGLGGPAVQPIDGQGQIPFQPAPQFMEQWTQHWSQAGIGMGIGTPMQEAFDRADAAIAAANLVGDLAVVAVTDGAPNCFPDAQNMQTDLEVNRAKNWLATRNIKTYVVGLPGADGVQLLNDVAAQGGTSQYIIPDDPKMLEDKLRALVGETIKSRFDSCSIHLSPAADPADKLQMVVVLSKDNSVNRVPHMLTADSGWTISADGTQVELTGQVCSDAMSGRFTTIRFNYACKSGGPPPPPFITPS
jgi:hypothetical protein